MFKYRAALSKGEEIRYISHLDYASLMQRAICRAKLPAAYSEGFNPHMKISFATAISVGVTAVEEYMEFELTEEMSVTMVAKKLIAELPAGVKLLRLVKCETKMPALMSAADEARYEIILPWNCNEKFSAAKAIDEFKRAGSCIYHRITPKKKRDIDVKKFVKKLTVLKEDSTEIRLGLNISITSTGSVKPSEVLQVLYEQFSLSIIPEAALIIRNELLSNGQPLV